MTYTKTIPPDRLWHVAEFARRLPDLMIDAPNDKRAALPFKVWEGDHPDCTVELNAHLYREGDFLVMEFDTLTGKDVYEVCAAVAEQIAPTLPTLVLHPLVFKEVSQQPWVHGDLMWEWSRTPSQVAAKEKA